MGRTGRAMKYKTILADPPWKEDGGSRGAQHHYPLMRTTEIIALKKMVDDIADVDCHLYLWVTNRFLEDGLRVIKEWGFRYIQLLIWIKPSIGIGQYFRGASEPCLFAARGKALFKNRDNGIGISDTPTIFYARKSGHSKKPQMFYSIIEKVSFPPFMELFARQRREGWDAWGNEIEQ